MQVIGAYFSKKQKRQALKKWLVGRGVVKLTCRNYMRRPEHKRHQGFQQIIYSWVQQTLHARIQQRLHSWGRWTEKYRFWRHLLWRRSPGRPQLWRNWWRSWAFYQFIEDLVYSTFNTWRRYPVHALTALVVAGLVLTGTHWLYHTVFHQLPDPQDLVRYQPQMTTRILDRHGELLFQVYADENRTVIPLEEIPAHLKYATIAIEDQDFYYHHGFSVRGIVRAVLANIRQEPLQGGSTITQQLVKNRLLGPERTLSRKLREFLLAILVEGQFSKDEILEMYLNQVAYGGSVYGVEAAAQRYFGKSARDLSLAESAMLAGLPVAPSLYNPFGPQPELAFRRQEEVIRRMMEDGYISADDARRARQKPLSFRRDIIDIRAPHFVMYVKDILSKEYGDKLLYQGGLEVTTTIDLQLQDQAQQIITDEVESLRQLRVGNAASLVTNPQTGEVLAMVGSANYFDFANDGQVNVTLRPRQPGSAIKPLTYATALEQGLTPTTILYDTPITYYAPGSRPYSPRNYDNRFRGPVTLREALASSYNVPAVKTLEQIGVYTLIDKAEEMGISTWQDRRRFGLSLTLGGGEVLMTDLVTAFGVFANHGLKTDLNPILTITTYDGEVLYQNKCALQNQDCPQDKALDPRVAFLVTNILADNAARTPGFGPQSVLYLPGQEVGVKTGTTNNLRDNWAIGYTSDRVVGVWVGNNDNSPMSYIASGITGASTAWNSIMQLVLDDTPHQFTKPQGLVQTAVCAPSNTLPCTGCPLIIEDYFLEETVPRQSCGSYYWTDASFELGNNLD